MSKLRKLIQRRTEINKELRTATGSTKYKLEAELRAVNKEINLLDEKRK